ncbi:hypothetical protein BCR34DRAFT_607236 [Clohesyomyces aquaticus]|uniref:Ubiquitin-like-conjugating enzyme ATG10 n=1 Tax=Clohesyomyces aquaticus TaxID=1231657 RepID=A0A1Y1YHV9_9PLEO|nr:hypothetical protein BCR34DRAFT_607236 [Clohesyomyces aquaticus]
MAESTAFPLISKSDFEDACTELSALFAKHSTLQQEWLSVEVETRNGIKFLKIAKPLREFESAQGGDHVLRRGNGLEMEEEVEEDEEALANPPSGQNAVIEYDIILSPSYQVPVLYFNIKDPLFRYPPTMKTLYQHLVSPYFKPQAERVSVIGGITVTDHPLTNTPVFFIHPCQTVAVLEASRGIQELIPREYLMLWIGALGGCVGLHLPIALAEK